MKALTARQQELLDFIEHHIVDKGYPPSIREMADQMGIRSTNGVNDHLKALERKGYLVREAGLKSRAIALLHPSAAQTRNEAPEVLHVPILGRVAAGQPILAEEHLEGHWNLDPSMIGRAGVQFALQVRGDSMIEKGILDGDTVFVRQQNHADAGQTVVAMIEGEATVKTFRPYKDQVVFEPANPDVAPIVIHRSDFRQTDILGVVTGVFRRVR